MSQENGTPDTTPAEVSEDFNRILAEIYADIDLPHIDITEIPVNTLPPF